MGEISTGSIHRPELRALPDRAAAVVHQTFPIEQLSSLILRHKSFELLHVNERWCNFIYEFDEFL